MMLTCWRHDLATRGPCLRHAFAMMLLCCIHDVLTACQVNGTPEPNVGTMAMARHPQRSNGPCSLAT
eukprot:11215628-Lingulodinium_polyedra.AAC.1